MKGGTTRDATSETTIRKIVLLHVHYGSGAKEKFYRSEQVGRQNDAAKFH